VIIPDRLRDDREHRRDLVRWALQGVLLAMVGGKRERLYLHAEPGLSALLLYAAVRLLPPSATLGLRFSTFEPAHGALREFKSGQAVGTYAPRKGMENDYFSRRGYALDTLGSFGCSVELRHRIPVIEELIELAALGKWGDINEIHRLCTAGEPVAVLTQAAEMLGPMRRLAMGKAQIADFLSLTKSARGREVLQQHEESAWPSIRDASLTNATVRTAFKAWLLERPRYEKFLDWSVKALEVGDGNEWQQRWDLLTNLADNNKQLLRSALLTSLTRIAACGALESHRLRLRLLLLKKWQAVDAPGAVLPAPISGLLSPRSAEELEQVVAGGFSKEWLLQAVCAALPVPATREFAVRFLRRAEDRMLDGFCEEINRFPVPPDQLAMLAPLLSPGDPDAPAFYGRLAKGLKLADATRHALLEKAGAYGEPWIDFWLGDNHLVNLLVQVNSGPESYRFWNAFFRSLNASVVLGADTKTRRLLKCLRQACERLGNKAPPACAEVIDDWEQLCDVFAGQASLPSTASTLTKVCERRGVTAAELLRGYFTRCVQNKPACDETIEPFHAIFTAFYPSPRVDDVQGHHTRLNCWLEVIAGCEDRKMVAHYQAYYVTHYIPIAWRQTLAEKCNTAGCLRKEAYKYIVNFKPPKVKRETAPAIVPVLDLPSQDSSAVSSASLLRKSLERIIGPLEKREWFLLAGGAGIGMVFMLTIVFIWSLIPHGAAVVNDSNESEKKLEKLTKEYANLKTEKSAFETENASLKRRVDENTLRLSSLREDYSLLIEFGIDVLKERFESVKREIHKENDSELARKEMEQNERLTKLQPLIRDTNHDDNNNRKTILTKLKDARTENNNLADKAGRQITEPQRPPQMNPAVP
jgi:hypothetical protein